jgi:hypothetical protein
MKNIKRFLVAVFWFFTPFQFLLSFQIETTTQPDFLVVKMKVPSLRIQTKDNFHRLKIKNASFYPKRGKPYLPVKNLFFLLPPQKSVERIEIISVKKSLLEGEFTLHTTGGPIPLSVKKEGKPLSPLPCPLFNYFYPQNLIKESPIQYWDGYPLLPLTIFLVQYNPALKKLVRIESLEFKVKLRKVPSSPQNFPQVSPSFLPTKIRKLVVNQEFLKRSPQNFLNSLTLRKQEEEKIFYLIITNEEMYIPFLELLEFKKREKGFEGVVVKLAEIYQQYPGGDRPQQIRNCIRGYYQRYRVQGYQVYVLLGGDVWRNRRIITDPIYQNQREILENEERELEAKEDLTPEEEQRLEEINKELVKIREKAEILPARIVETTVRGAVLLPERVFTKTMAADLYYACLDGEWGEDKNKDGILQAKEMSREIDLMPEVYVGRAPVDTLTEAKNFVAKVIGFEKKPSPHLKNILFLCYRFDKVNDSVIIAEEIQNLIPEGGGFQIHREYTSRGGATNSVWGILPEIGIFNHNGHAHISGFGASHFDPPLPPGALYYFSMGVNNTRNHSPSGKLFFFNSCGCYAGDFTGDEVGEGWEVTVSFSLKKERRALEKKPDRTPEEERRLKQLKENLLNFSLFDDCVTEEMILHSTGNAIATVSNSSYGLYDETDARLYSGEYQIEFYQKYLREGLLRVGEILASSKITFIPYSHQETPYLWIQFCLNLLGDPTLKLSPLPRQVLFSSVLYPEVPYLYISPNHPFDLSIRLKNFSSQSIRGVKAILSTGDPKVEIIKNIAEFGPIPPYGTADNRTSPYSLKISECPYEYQIKFDLLIKIESREERDAFVLKVINNQQAQEKIRIYPNPCYLNKDSVLNFINIPYLPGKRTEVRIYNLAGELVRVLKEGVDLKEDNIRRLTPRVLHCFWDFKNESGNLLNSGVYLYLIKTPTGVKKGKIALLREK